MNLNRSLKKGQSLIEVVVALAVVSLLAVALISTSLVTQRTSKAAANDTQATKLVQQNIEQMRVFRDRKGYSALVDGTCYTLIIANVSDPNTWSIAACSGGTINGEVITQANVVFTRRIAIATPGGTSNQKRITVTVTWPDQGGTQTVSNVTILSNCISGADSC